jgi:hypothetical protein
LFVCLFVCFFEGRGDKEDESGGVGDLGEKLGKPGESDLPSLYYEAVKSSDHLHAIHFECILVQSQNRRALSSSCHVFLHARLVQQEGFLAAKVALGRMILDLEEKTG